MSKLETAELVLELDRYNDDRNGLAEFSTRAADGVASESLTLLTTTWQEMGYPHFITVTAKTTK